MYLIFAHAGGVLDVIIRQRLLRKCLKGVNMAIINMLYVKFTNFARRNKLPLHTHPSGLHGSFCCIPVWTRVEYIVYGVDNHSYVSRRSPQILTRLNFWVSR